MLTEKDQVDIIQKSMQSLRSEIQSRIDSNTKFGEAIIASIAAVIILKDTINILQFLPLLPILGLLLLNLSQRSELSFHKLGRRLMDDEEKINRLTGSTVLDYETRLWPERKERFNKWKWLRLIGYIIVTFVAEWLIILSMTSSELNHSPVTKWGAYMIAPLIILFTVATFVDQWKLYRNNPLEPTSEPIHVSSSESEDTEKTFTA